MLPRRARRLLPTLSLIALVTAPLAVALPAEAAPDGSRVVISEVYGGGGNSGAVYKQDFVELYNPTDAPVDLAGTSIQYRSATGTANPSGLAPLTGSIASHSYFTISLGPVGVNGADLPTPSQVGPAGVNLSGTTGTVFFASQATVLVSPPTGSITANPAVIDLVGYGSSNTFETAVIPGQGNGTSSQRDADGTDTDHNAVDLTVGAPTFGVGPVVVPPEPTDATIEQIQGTGDASPLAGQTVNTTGVVTAAYPTGNFSGFYLQELANEATDPNASDGIFVFSPSEVGEVAIGDYVTVTGPVSEFGGLTEIGPTTNGVSVQPLPGGAVAPTATATAFPTTDAARERLEGMLVDPQGAFTVGDTFDLNSFGEIGLAAGTTPIMTPTEVADAQDAAAIAAARADIEARQLALDDGSSINFIGADANKDIPLPWLTTDNPVRTGAAVTFVDEVVLDFRNGTWKFQPTSRVTDDGQGVATFENTRTAAPQAVGGNVRIASFNVLNYFTRTGADHVADGGTCTWFDDRDGNHITVNDCGATGPRGAADDTNLARQQAKIVEAIQALGADVVSLEEIENSAKFGPDRDAALATLVDALNADAGGGVWAFAPTPASAGDQSTEDVIRTAFIYRSAAVELVGPSVILQSPAFANARDPLAQGFKPVGGTADSVFVAIVNHFKSKGSGPDDGTGQGLSNQERIAQANALVTFADQVKSDLGTDKVFLTGDFNAYTQEDPLQVLYAAGYTDIGSALHPEEYTYVFDGLTGSLDHVLANQAAMDTVTGAHVWNINSVESVANEYSRYNYNATLFYEPTPYRASDHDPLVVGLELTTVSATTTTVTVPDVAKKSAATATIVVTGGPTPTGTVRVFEDGVLVSTAVLSAGRASVVLPVHKQAGTHTVTVQYLGDAGHQPSTGGDSYQVLKK